MLEYPFSDPRSDPAPVDAAGLASTLPIITTFDGRRLAMAHAVDPVIGLARQAVAGYRIEPRLSHADTGCPLSAQERGGLLASDMELIDATTLAHGLDRLSEGRGPGEHPSLILAVSFLTASSQRARTRLLPIAPPLRAALQASVIWLLTDLPDGAPSGRLVEVTSLMKPYGRAVFAKTRLNGAALKAARSAGIAGLVLEPQRPPANDTDAALWLLQAGKMAERAAPALVAADLPSRDLLAMAAEAGFTHATLAAGGPAV